MAPPPWRQVEQDSLGYGSLAVSKHAGFVGYIELDIIYVGYISHSQDKNSVQPKIKIYLD
jgi:hypothetical protein